MQLDAAVDEEKLRTFGIQLQSVREDHEGRLSTHERLQEHRGAERQFELIKGYLKVVNERLNDIEARQRKYNSR